MLYAVGGIAFSEVLKVPVVMQKEVTSALPWLAASVPMTVSSSVLYGSLEGRGQFAILNIIKVFEAIMFQVIPLAVAYFRGPGLDWIIPSAVLAEVISIFPVAWAAVRYVPLTHLQRPSRRWARILFGYGAWVSITNVITPVLDTLDRFLIGATLGASAVTYYTIPYSMATRVNVLLPGALARTIFPLLSRETGTGANELGKKSHFRSCRRVDSNCGLRDTCDAAFFDCLGRG